MTTHNGRHSIKHELVVGELVGELVVDIRVLTVRLENRARDALIDDGVLLSLVIVDRHAGVGVDCYITSNNFILIGRSSKAAGGEKRKENR